MTRAIGNAMILRAGAILIMAGLIAVSILVSAAFHRLAQKAQAQECASLPTGGACPVEPRFTLSKQASINPLLP